MMRIYRERRPDLVYYVTKIGGKHEPYSRSLVERALRAHVLRV